MILSSCGDIILDGGLSCSSCGDVISKVYSLSLPKCPHFFCKPCIEIMLYGLTKPDNLCHLCPTSDCANTSCGLPDVKRRYDVEKALHTTMVHCPGCNQTMCHAKYIHHHEICRSIYKCVFSAWLFKETDILDHYINAPCCKKLYIGGKYGPEVSVDLCKRGAVVVTNESGVIVIHRDKATSNFHIMYLKENNFGANVCRLFDVNDLAVTKKTLDFLSYPLNFTGNNNTR